VGGLRLVDIHPFEDCIKTLINEEKEERLSEFLQTAFLENDYYVLSNKTYPFIPI
jgi:hypothetical protein